MNENKMSDPKRYNFWMYQKRSEELGGMARMTQEECEHGEWVHHSDYATLQAEVSRLKMEESKLLTFTETLEGEITELSEDRKSLYLRSESFADQILELKAENERLRSASFVTAVPSEEYERVIKAGDELAKELATAWSSTVSELDETAPIYQWLAAKEGRDAK